MKKGVVLYVIGGANPDDEFKVEDAVKGLDIKATGLRRFFRINSF